MSASTSGPETASAGGPSTVPVPGPFTLVGDAAPVCVDGVCELPPRTEATPGDVGDAPASPVTASAVAPTA